MPVAYFDAHCDTLTAVLENGGGLFENRFHVDFRRLGAYAPCAQVFAIWNGRYEEKVALLRRECAAHADAVALCRSGGEVRAANSAGKIAALLSVEGAESLGCDIGRLREARRREGIVMLNLCWNSDNALCGSAFGAGTGLTEKGREFVRECQRIGVAVDMSHAGERTFWDTLEIAEKPVIASHSDSAALCSTFPRNLTDAQFEALVRCGGGAGINLCPDFLSDGGADIDDAVRHIEHFLALGGEQAVFIGADFDGIDATPRGISGVQDMERLYDALLARNYPDELVADIFYGNLLRILESTGATQEESTR